MFRDTKLNTHFNKNDKRKFVQRLLEVSKTGTAIIGDSPVKDDCIEFAIECLGEHIEDRVGCVYIARNQLTPTLIKIGRTTKEVNQREKTLNSAGVQGKIEIIFHANTVDCVLAETFIHQTLKEFNDHKEFFDISAAVAEEIITRCTAATNDLYLRIFAALGINIENGNVWRLSHD